MSRLPVIITFLVVLILVVSCSQQRITLPQNNDNTCTDIDSSQRVLLGYYTVELDPATSSAIILPARNLSDHLNAKPFLLGWPCNDCLRILNLQFLPGNRVEADIYVKHPYPNPVFTVFDLRVITIFPEEETFYSTGVSYALENRDGLTGLWDNSFIPGEINGYKAYNKETARRPFGPGDIFFEHFVVQLPPGDLRFDIAVDCSWEMNDGINFPIEMNSQEVIDLEGNITRGMLSSGGSAEMSVSMHDYQGTDTIDSVWAYCQDLFYAPVQLDLSEDDGNNAVFSKIVTNEKHAPNGTYNVLVKVTDVDDAYSAYDLASYVVLQAEVGPIYITITIEEDSDYKTPGNNYVFDSYKGYAGRSVIDHLNYSGPWDFTSVPFTTSAERSILAKDDPEVSLLTSENYPLAEYYVKDIGGFSFSNILYLPEQHDFVYDELEQLGFYDEEVYLGAVVWDATTTVIEYPISNMTNFSRHYCSGLCIYMQLDRETKALGSGLCTIPLNGGTTRNALLLRTTFHFNLAFIPYQQAIVYEWFDDDGNLLAAVTCAQLTGEGKWDESTYEITGDGTVLALKESNRE